MQTKAEDFSQEEGLKYQARQMKAWKQMLTPVVYLLVEEEVRFHNNQLLPEQDGNYVFRGTDISNFIVNALLERFEDKQPI